MGRVYHIGRSDARGVGRRPRIAALLTAQATFLLRVGNIHTEGAEGRMGDFSASTLLPKFQGCSRFLSLYRVSGIQRPLQRHR